MTNLEIVRGLYADFGKGNVAGVMGAMSPKIVWNEAEHFPYADGNPYVGPEAVAKGVFSRCVSEWDGFTVNPEEFIDGGSTIVALGRYGGVYRKTGRKQHTQFAHVWRLEGGKAVRFQQYADTLGVAEVIGGERMGQVARH